MSILVIAEHNNTELNPSTLHTVTAASQAGGDVTVLVAGHNAGDVAKEAANINGVSGVLHADGA
ncbi:MAG: electron transfer flavoprotein subunit alpha/FixB family protein, partial [Candidatus Puniceispirillales bacterium]